MKDTDHDSVLTFGRLMIILKGLTGQLVIRLGSVNTSLMLNTCLISQDTLGGGFDATQAYVGELANLNIWNRKLSTPEIYNLATCNSKAPAGNVFSWTESNIEVFGGATKWTFEPCRSLN